MAETIIELRALSKTYRVTERESGFKASIVSLVNRKYREVRAVESVSFALEQGEMVV